MKLFIPLFFAATLALVNIASGQAIVENPKAVFCSAKCLKFMDKELQLTAAAAALSIDGHVASPVDVNLSPNKDIKKLLDPSSTASPTPWSSPRVTFLHPPNMGLVATTGPQYSSSSSSLPSVISPSLTFPNLAGANV
ncbi:hypothetical protein CF326_g6270 [Tilletia indica]|nr:hypothetical protein CF326_g6270 [Tilletia indica]